MTIERILELILGNIGVLVLLLFIIYGGYKRWWVFGSFYADQKETINKLENKLEESTSTSETNVRLVTRVVDIAEKQQQSV